MNKTEARQKAKNFLFELSPKDQLESRVLNQLEIALQPYQNIAIYSAHPPELPIGEIAGRLPKKKFYYPKILSLAEKTMQFVFPETWLTGPYRILEPMGSDILPVSELDCFVLPALGYNSRGYRLGRGGGFYDRALAGISAKKMIGVSPERLFPVDFSEDPHDIRVSQLITENQTIFLDSEPNFLR